MIRIDSRTGTGETSDNENDVDSDLGSTSSGSLVPSSKEQHNESVEKEEDSRFKRRKTAKFKKHPDAPKRFRSAFIIFSQHRHKQLRAKLNAEGGEVDTMNIAGQISDEWRGLKPDAKREWEEMARKDKERYQREKAEYVGPWKVRTNLRKPKDPNSPKKPVPAYFAFSNERRQEVKNSNPSATNGEVSRLLSKMWKSAPDEVRKFYLDREAEEREKYTESMAKWKAKRRREATDQAHEESMKEEKGEALGVEQVNEKDIASQDRSASFNGSGNNVSPAVSLRATAPLVHQNQGWTHVVDEGREDIRASHSATRSLYDAYGRLCQEQRLSQDFLGATRLHQQAQAAPIPSDAGLLLQLLSRIQTPSQPNFGNSDLIRQLLTSALHGQNAPSLTSSQGDPHLQPTSNLPSSSSAGFAGGWLGGIRIPPAEPSNFRQDTGYPDPTWLDTVLLDMLKRQQTSTGFGSRNRWIEESSLRPLLGGDASSAGLTGLVHSAGHPISGIHSVSGSTVESTILLHMLQQQMVGQTAASTATSVTDSVLHSNLGSSNALHNLLQQLGAASRGSGDDRGVRRL